MLVKKQPKDIYDAMQSLEYEINTLFTSNGQTPFVTVGFGLGDDWYSREIQKSNFECPDWWFRFRTPYCHFP